MNNKTLHLIASPIGNSEDISLRALRLLQSATLIAAEDTRVARRLLAVLKIQSSAHFISLRAHNEITASEKLFARLGEGEIAVYLSDAGTPGISDPGGRLVRLARRAGVQIIALPGACALTTLVSAAGIFSNDGIHFFGFPPRPTRQRQQFFLSLRSLHGCVVLFESPHRIKKTVTELRDTLGPQQRAVLGRELTKWHEQIVDTTLAELTMAIEDGSIPIRGEFSLLIETPGLAVIEVAAEALYQELSARLPPRQAAAVTAKVTGVSASQLYCDHLKQK